MYVREVHIRNVKLLRDVSISFLRGDSERMWTVLIGENGLCKTTILQAIGLAASGRDRANQLANVPSLPDRRLSRKFSRIDARFSFDAESRVERPYPQLEVEVEGVPIVHSMLAIANKSYVFFGTSIYLHQRITRTMLDRSGWSEMRSPNPIGLVRAQNSPGWFVAGYGVERRLPEPNNSPKMIDPAFQ